MIRNLISLTKHSFIIKPKFLFSNMDMGHYDSRRREPVYTKQQKDILKKAGFQFRLPAHSGRFQDSLYMPGLDKSELIRLQTEAIMKGELMLSNTFVAIFMYHLVKNRLLTSDMMKILDSWIPRHKGQYDARQTFGCLYASIVMNRKDLIQFFMGQISSSSYKFNLQQSLELVEALNKNKSMTVQEKHNFWSQNFKECFVTQMDNINQKRTKIILRIFDAFRQLEYFDQTIWEKIFILMDKKGGWLRVALIQRLYPLSGTFPQAKALFNKYYNKLSHNPHALWRYNFQQLRLYSSEEMIAKSQENIQMNPSFRTLLPPQKLDNLIQRYDIWLERGSVKQDQQIIRDKSQSFAYAIKDRFTAMAKDKIDYSKLTKKEFQQLFGEYNEELMKDKQKKEGEQNEQESNEQK